MTGYFVTTKKDYMKFIVLRYQLVDENKSENEATAENSTDDTNVTV
ncbi:hypothetical protein AGMMS5026_02300 [Endomicrobiia bacterium]|nr:hypothetical protein [Candidatus Endomicrobium trichonymphae]GHT06234.1 hypothetical protein AGMMS49523_07390 [Endomicrobiia bacterium]GHT14593.1 hypothetical protein AGMMS49571_10550 [Endomicrobiia bacterium]GHT18680.1 hypothetical protein AGMMS49929_00810 [Endomicrobiia bacterium]GHT24513.1 hypothetical protein AGMMS49953_07170 [Endomicrobiia bacterium]GHT28838.1 hypothetical protein AGMMS49995_10340 [Endomicrobiia bacterium]